MKLNFIELNEIWPPGLEPAELRLFIRKQLIKYGEPLRWSLTAIEHEEDHAIVRRMRIEAVVINLGKS